MSAIYNNKVQWEDLDLFRKSYRESKAFKKEMKLLAQ